jgi:hypothetical protein
VNQVAEAGWNLDTIIAYLKEHGASMEMDNDGQIVVYTNLTTGSDGELLEMGDWE